MSKVGDFLKHLFSRRYEEKPVEIKFEVDQTRAREDNMKVKEKPVEIEESYEDLLPLRKIKPLTPEEKAKFEADKIDNALNLGKYSKEKKDYNTSFRAYFSAYLQLAAAGPLSLKQLPFLKRIRDGLEEISEKGPNVVGVKDFISKVDNVIQQYEITSHYKKSKPLEENLAAAILAISSFILAIFFLYPNVTGFAISRSIEIPNSNNMGLLLFLIGLVFTFLYVKNQENK